jgi:hypothetical protein
MRQKKVYQNKFYLKINFLIKIKKLQILFFLKLIIFYINLKKVFKKKEIIKNKN